MTSKFVETRFQTLFGTLLASDRLWKFLFYDYTTTTVTQIQQHIVAPERILKWEGAPVRSERRGPIRRKAPEKLFWSCPIHFLALKAQLVVLVSAFVMVSTVWSISCLLLFYSRCPLCPVICKSGGHRARAPNFPWSRRHCNSRHQMMMIWWWRRNW